MRAMPQPSPHSALFGRCAWMLAFVCGSATACDAAEKPTPRAAPKAKAVDAKTDTEEEPAPRPEVKADAKPPAAPAVGAKLGVATAKVDSKTLLDEDGTYNYSKDAFGELESGLADKAVLAKFGEPESKDGREEEGATGDIVELWHYPKQGVVLTMVSQTMTSAQSVSGITISAPCAFKTKLGIGVGSTRADVSAAYGAFKDPEFPAGPEQFIAGSVYGGMFFDFTKDEVVSMFMGVGAE